MCDRILDTCNQYQFHNSAVQILVYVYNLHMYTHVWNACYAFHTILKQWIKYFIEFFGLVCVGFWSIVFGKPNNDSEYVIVDFSLLIECKLVLPSIITHFEL